MSHEPHDGGASNRGYRGLKVWQKAMDLADKVYDVAQTWPESERYGLSSQIRRAAVSVPSNIAEGQGRGNAGDFCRFLDIAYGSLCELETQVQLAGRRRMSDPRTVADVLTASDEVGRMIRRLSQSIRSAGTLRESEPNYDAFAEPDS